VRVLRPVQPPRKETDLIQGRIAKLFEEEIFHPLVAALGMKVEGVFNAASGFKALEAAIASGRITFHRGIFSGRFDSSISKSLKEIGAVWDDSIKAFRIHADDLSPNIKSAVALSETAFKRRTNNIIQKANEILEASPWEKLRVSDLFKSAVFHMDKDFRKNVEKIKVHPQVSETRADEISREWENNLKLKVKDFVDVQVVEMRQQVKDAWLSGNRYGFLKQTIKDMYGVADRKAEFLAQQESHLLTAAYQGSKYVEAGAPYYLWRCVTGTPEHPTRPRHKELSAMSDRGIIFRWDDPPVSTGKKEQARRNNPKEDYRCRCEAFPIFIPAGAKVIKLPDHCYRIEAA
jgi:SPP1 gp7 family putative phage head morphogenesis protein